MIYNVVLVSGVQQSDSVIHIHVSILFQILFPFRLLQSVEQSSLCYTVGPCWLSILNIAGLLTTFQIAEARQRFQVPCFTAFEAVVTVTQLTAVMYLTQT